MVNVLLALLSVVLILLLLLDGFEAMVLPRRVTHSFRLTRLYFRCLWAFWRFLACRLPKRPRLALLGVFGPLSMLGLFVVWVVGLITAFALLHWSLGTAMTPAGPEADFLTYFYYSGATFLTLGYGDVVPVGPVGRVLSVMEAGLGFGFMAVIIGYLPVLFQAFSAREVTISLLDARAGSPPSAAQVLLRVGQAGHLPALDPFLAEWERWAAQLLESHLSFPVLGFYRSQHDNQSWLAALTVILDTCSLILAGVKGVHPYQAQLTFAMARHAVVDLAMVLGTPPRPSEPDRLTAARLASLRAQLVRAGLDLREGAAFEKKLTELRGAYEPFANGLSRFFLLPLPEIVPDRVVVDNWQTSAWMRRIAGLGSLPAGERDDGHFD
jgi:hypothetical protein